MAKFLTTAGVIHQVEDIIKGAKKKLVLISPFVQINKMIMERLHQASDSGVQIILIYGKDELKRTEKKQLESIENLTLYYYQNLHAKCYFNETEMVITSMNLYEFSQRNNREMGILVKKNEDTTLFNDAVNETHSIIKAAAEIQNNNSSKKKAETNTLAEKNLFPLNETDLKLIHDHFNSNYYNCIVNSTSNYVYCKEILGFADVMIREGFEVRLHHNLYSETLLIKKLNDLNFKFLNYNYEYQITDSSQSQTKFIITSKDAINLKKLLEDFDKIIKRITYATKNVSHKKRLYM